MFNNNKTGRYIDENGTISGAISFSDEDKLVTELVNSSKTAAELRKQNELYEKELKIIRRNGTITKWAAIIAAIFAVVSAIAPIILAQLMK